MKEKNILVAPIFMAVVMLLAVGAVGELFDSLVSKIKSLASSSDKSYEHEVEVAPQL